MTENERLTFETELGISIDKNEDCPTMSICWNCDIPPRKCNYFKDAIDKLAKYEAIGTVEEFKALKEKEERFDRNIKMFNEIGLEIRNKAIDDVFDFLKTQRGEKYKRVNFDDLEIRKYKEQLKAGGNND